MGTRGDRGSKKVTEKEGKNEKMKGGKNSKNSGKYSSNLPPTS